jgi:hypothetical protein
MSWKKLGPYNLKCLYKWHSKLAGAVSGARLGTDGMEADGMEADEMDEDVEEGKASAGAGGGRGFHLSTSHLILNSSDQRAVLCPVYDGL